MSMPANPPANARSPFSSFRGHHIGLRVADFESAKQWYLQKLDFRVLHEWEDMGLHWAYLSPAADDEFHLELMGAPTDRSTMSFDTVGDSLSNAGYLHFCMEVADIELTKGALEERGVEVLTPVLDARNVSRKIFFIRDPLGNLIELAERTPGALA